MIKREMGNGLWYRERWETAYEKERDETWPMVKRETRLGL